MIRTFARICVLFFALLSYQGAAYGWQDRPAELFQMCAQCHGQHGEGNRAFGAPSIAGLPEWYIHSELDKFHNGGRGASPGDINGMRMRPMARILDDANRDQMAKYVAAMPRPVLTSFVQGNLVKGEAKYQVCVACHGAKAEGNQQLSAPPLVNASDWYLLTQLKNFKAKARGYDAALDPNGAAMMGMAAMVDEQGAVDVVAYLNTLKAEK